ncbi:MAG TPA: response regulator [Leptospiraceae bacterium]|nr:response regulator [Leptospiraceae bacterium]
MNNFVVLKTSAEMNLENSRTLKSESRGKYRKAENRILLVEDNIIIASIQTKSLNKVGHTVIHVSSGEDAVQFCSENRDKIDLILMDIDLGNGIDGTEAAEIILEEHNIY